MNTAEIIYLLDDENVFRLRLSMLLRRAGFEGSVRAFMEPETFLKALQESDPPDVLLVDCNLKRGAVDGPYIVAEVAPKLPERSLIGIITSILDDETIDEAMRAGAHFYIYKVKGTGLARPLAEFRTVFFDGDKPRWPRPGFQVFR